MRSVKVIRAINLERVEGAIKCFLYDIVEMYDDIYKRIATLTLCRKYNNELLKNIIYGYVWCNIHRVGRK